MKLNAKALAATVFTALTLTTFLPLAHADEEVEVVVDRETYESVVDGLIEGIEEGRYQTVDNDDGTRSGVIDMSDN